VSGSEARVSQLFKTVQSLKSHRLLFCPPPKCPISCRVGR